MTKKKTAALILTGLLTLSAPAALAAEVRLPAGYTALNLRKGPGTNYAVSGWALDGDEIDVLKYGSSWSQVELAKNGKTGYIKNGFIDDSGDPDTPDAPAVGAEFDLGTVTGRSVNLRKGPGTGYAVVSSAARGARLELHGESGNWYYARSASGAKGYISKNYVSAGASYTTSARVNLRQSPNGSLIRTLPYGTKLTVLSASGDWRRVKLGSTLGWVYARYLR